MREVPVMQPAAKVGLIRLSSESEELPEGRTQFTQTT